MTSTAELNRDYDLTGVPAIVAGSVKLGLLEGIAVLLFSLASRLLGGVVETIVCGIILIVGVAAVSMLPGLWTRPRTIEGIAGAAGIGLGATAVFLLVDVVLLQNIGTYTNRWYEIGGGSNWWYHPVWWMVGTFIPWMGAWLLANQTNRNGRPSVGQGLITALGLAVLIGAAATLLGISRGALGTGDFRGGVSSRTRPGHAHFWYREAPHLTRCAGSDFSFVSSAGCSHHSWRGQLHFSGRSWARSLR